MVIIIISMAQNFSILLNVPFLLALLLFFFLFLLIIFVTGKVEAISLKQFLTQQTYISYRNEFYDKCLPNN